MLPLHMPLSAITAERNGRFDNSSPLTRGLTRGVCRLLTETGFGPITEFRLPNRRRADVMGLGSGSEFVIVEVKSSFADWPGAKPNGRIICPSCDRILFCRPGKLPSSISLPT